MEQQQKWTGIYKQIRGRWCIQIELQEGKLIWGERVVNVTHPDTIEMETYRSLLLEVRASLTNSSGDTAIYKRKKSRTNQPITFSNLVSISTEADAAFTIKSKIANSEVIYWRSPDAEVKLKPEYLDVFSDDEGWLYEFARDKKGNVTAHSSVWAELSEFLSWKAINPT